MYPNLRPDHVTAIQTAHTLDELKAAVLTTLDLVAADLDRLWDAVNALKDGTR